MLGFRPAFLLGWLSLIWGLHFSSFPPLFWSSRNGKRPGLVELLRPAKGLVCWTSKLCVRKDYTDYTR